VIGLGEIHVRLQQLQKNLIKVFVIFVDDYNGHMNVEKLSRIDRVTFGVTETD